MSKESPSECAGSVLMTTVRYPAAAQRTAVAAATDVLPTPPLPVKRTTRTGEVYVRGVGGRRSWKVRHAPPALRATSPLPWGGASLWSGRSPPLPGRDHLLHVLLHERFDVFQDRDRNLGVVLGQVGNALDRLQDLHVLAVGLVRLRRGML